MAWGSAIRPSSVGSRPQADRSVVRRDEQWQRERGAAVGAVDAEPEPAVEAALTVRAALPRRARRRGERWRPRCRRFGGGERVLSTRRGARSPPSSSALGSIGAWPGATTSNWRGSYRRSGNGKGFDDGLDGVGEQDSGAVERLQPVRHEAVEATPVRSASNLRHRGPPAIDAGIRSLALGPAVDDEVGERLHGGTAALAAAVARGGAHEQRGDRAARRGAEARRGRPRSRCR